MRSVKSLSVLFAMASLGAWGIAACSADGDSPGIDEGQDSGGNTTRPGVDGATDSQVGTDATLTDSGRNDAGKDAAGDATDSAVADVVQDTQVVDAGQDTGSPQGSPCSPVNQVEQQTCGFCGHQSRICLASGDAGDGGTTGEWGAWGFCQGEVANGCAPGATASEPCGLCGTRQRICQNDCTYAVGTCSGQPTNACQPGTTDFQVGLSCDAGGRQRSCSGDAGPSAACTWGNFGSCYVPEGGTNTLWMNLPDTVGAKASNTFTIPTSQSMYRLSILDDCPTATISSFATTNYQYVEVHNPTARTATVSIWGSKASTGPDIDSIMAAYSGFSIPTTTTQRQACSSGVNDSCNDMVDPTSCLDGWAGLMSTDGYGVTVGPYNSVIVYMAAYYDTVSSNPHSGDFVLNVRTEQLQ